MERFLIFIIVCILFITLVQAKSNIGIHFVDWDERKECSPLTYTTPNNEEEIITSIKIASENNEKLKVIGGGLSFSGIQLINNGHMISLSRMNKILNVEHLEDGTALVEVQAGIVIRELCDMLDKLNLSLINLGATASQSIVGAASTGTHGTGTELGNLATQIVSLRIIDSSGNIHIASNDINKDLFDIARINIGALGVISSITIKAVPLWKMKKTMYDTSLTQLLLDLPSLLMKYERLQWSWLPYTDTATVVIRENVPWNTPIEPTGPDGGCWSASQPTSNCTDLSYKTLTDSLYHYEKRSLYTEMEMFINIEDTYDAVNDFILWMDTVKDLHNPNIYISAMIRYVKEDDITLSQCYGRNTTVMSFIAQSEADDSEIEEFALYSKGLEDLTEAKYNSRPHWGKVNYATSDYLRQTYGENYDIFEKKMKEMDPTRMFSNEYLDSRFDSK
jgi:L-gulonolactone oxidase